MQASGTRRSMAMSVVALGIAISAIGYSRLQASPTAASEVSAGVAESAVDRDQADRAISTSPGAGSLGADLGTVGDRFGGGNQAVDVLDEFGPDPLREINPETAAPSPPQPSTGLLRFVYFVEQDEVFDTESVARIERQALALQQFWFDQFGATFFLPESGIDVIYGEHSAEWYDATVNGDNPRWYRLMNIRREVWSALDINVDDDVRLVVYPSARIDGRVGANRYGSAWMDGDDLTCIDTDIATVPYSSQFPADCLTTVAHELGHVFGLGHQGDDVDCMQLGFYTYVSGGTRCVFSDTARQLVQADLRNTGWLDATPGDRR